jgi:choline dehydrogenase-like flavoprotein
MNARKVIDEAEYVVIGTGVGGGTLARELARRGKRVIMVEKGKELRKLGTSMTLVNMALNKGVIVTKEGYTSASAIMTGGSSVVTAGAYADPPPYLKDKWGIDLSQEIEETRRELGVQKVPENLCGASSLKVMEAANSMGYQWERLEKMVDPQKCVEGCSDCTLGCKRDAKWTVRTYLKEAMEKDARLYEQIDAQAVIHENGKALGVWGIDRSGKEVEFRGEKVIVAAGGMNSARILLRSGLWDAGNGFFMDPIATVCGVYDGPEKKMGTALDSPMSVGSKAFLDSPGLLLYTFVAPALGYLGTFVKDNPRNIVNLLGGYNRLISIQIKVKDGVNGRVFLDGSISKPLTQEEFKKLDMGAAIATEILIKAGCSAKSIQYAKYGGAHPGGTTRMGDVVDKNLETEIKNLYVGDASIFPEAFGRPTTGTIVPMIKRLAKHLSGQETN